MSEIRHLVITVEPDESPAIDLTGFNVYEAYQILWNAAAEIEGRFPQCRIIGLTGE